MTDKRTNGSARASDAKALHDHIVARTCRLADAMIRMSSRHIKERWNLRNTDLRLLNILDGDVPLSVNEISRRSLLDQAWVSRSLRALEAKQLVQRRDDSRDSRLTLVTLTGRGREILDESRPYAVWSEKVLLDGVDEKTLKALLDQLEANTQKLIDALGSPKRLQGKASSLECRPRAARPARRLRAGSSGHRTNNGKV
jgi:DNA-binding MarR family transcriptional regulator